MLSGLQDLKANESRLRDINKVASELESEGLMAEEVPMVQAQVSRSLEKFLSSPQFHSNVVVSICSNKSCSELHPARFECSSHARGFRQETRGVLIMSYVLCVEQDEADSKTASPWKVTSTGWR